jgi:hypothetical protein
VVEGFISAADDAQLIPDNFVRLFDDFVREGQRVARHDREEQLQIFYSDAGAVAPAILDTQRIIFHVVDRQTHPDRADIPLRRDKAAITRIQRGLGVGVINLRRVQFTEFDYFLFAECVTSEDMEFPGRNIFEPARSQNGFLSHLQAFCF